MTSHLLLAPSVHGRLRHRAVSAFAAKPELFSKLLAIHAGTRGLACFSPAGMASFARQTLSA